MTLLRCVPVRWAFCVLALGVLVASAQPAGGADPAAKLLGQMAAERKIWNVAFSPDGKLVALGGGKQLTAELAIWDVKTRKKQTDLFGHEDAICSVAFSPDGKTLASGGADWTVRLWDVATGKELAVFKDCPCVATSVAFSPDGKTLAASFGVSSADGKEPDRTPAGVVRLWDVETRKARATLKVGTGPAFELAFRPDGKALATTAQKWDAKGQRLIDGEVWFWDTASGKHTGTIKAHPGTLSAMVYSPDGQTLATAGDQWDDPDPSPGRVRVKLWDTTTLKLKRSELFFESWVKGLAFSPDGKVLVIGSGPIPEFDQFSVRFTRSDVVIVDARNLKELTRLPRQNYLGGVIFHPKEKVFATIDGHQLKLWELNDKR